MTNHYSHRHTEITADNLQIRRQEVPDPYRPLPIHHRVQPVNSGPLQQGQVDQNLEEPSVCGDEHTLGNPPTVGCDGLV